MLNSIFASSFEVLAFLTLSITPFPHLPRAQTHAPLFVILTHSAFYPFKHCDPICQVERVVGAGEVVL